MTIHARTKLFILSRQDIIVDGIRHVLERDCDSLVVTCVEPGDSCFERFCKTEPDLVFLHEDAVEFYPFDIIGRLRSQRPNVRILLFGRDMSHDRLLGYLREGDVQGYICDQMNSAGWLEAVNEVMAGRLWLDRELMDLLARQALGMEQQIHAVIENHLDTLKVALSNRELEILQLVLEGLTTREIAHHICLSEQSVKFHLSRLFKKFDANNRSQMIVSVFQRVCPVSNMIRLVRVYLDKQRIAQGRAPLIPDPLSNDA